MDLTAAVEDLQSKTAEHADRLDEHGKRLDEHGRILGLLQRDMGENRVTLRRIEDKIDGRLRDALNALPGWLGVVLALCMLLIAAITFGHDFWPATHPPLGG